MYSVVLYNDGGRFVVAGVKSSEGEAISAVIALALPIIISIIKA